MSAKADHLKRRDIRRAMGPAVAQHVTGTADAIMDLRGRHATMAQQFAEDSDVLHSALILHDAALVSFNQRLDAQQAEIERLLGPVGFWRRALTWLRVGK